jgi:aspartyl protease family protein
MRLTAALLACAAAALLFSAAPASAATVQVIGIGPAQVELIVDGAVVRSLRPGQTSPEGIRLIAVTGGRAVLEIDGRRQELALGQSNVAAVALKADRQGHFVTTAQVNGVPLQAIVDTGASVVSLGVADAERLGIAYRSGSPVPVMTANGAATGYAVTLASVQVGAIALANVEAVVSPGQQLPFILLGNSFLSRVEMQRSGDTLYLVPRN